jgi:drug/metabolite transporter (DMT)-like permease
LLAGVAVAFGGVVLIGVSVSSTADADPWGVVLCIVAAIAYAIGVVAQKPLLKDASGLHVTWLACVIGTVTCLPFIPALLDDLATASPSTIGWMVYLGVMPTALGFITWAYALARSTAGRLAAATYLVPPVAIIMGWLLLSETPPALALLGGAICLTGVYIARRVRRTPA